LARLANARRAFSFKASVSDTGEREKCDRLSLIIFRIVLLIVLRPTAAARVLVLLLGKLATPSLLAPLIGLIALLFGLVNAATVLAALLLTLGLRHRRVPGLEEYRQ
jgi:hypothetical protein